MLTKEQWTEIEGKLDYPWGCIALVCDGYKVQAIVKPRTPLHFVIEVYVNGVMKGEWYKGDAEEAKKFYRPVKVHTYRGSARTRAKAELAKKRLHSSMKVLYQEVLSAHFIMWYPWWTSPKAFCRNIRKTCKSIEYVGDKHASY